jgi:hypothetical protein
MCLIYEFYLDIICALENLVYKEISIIEIRFILEVQNVENEYHGKNLLYLMGWVVGGLYLLSMILTAGANLCGVCTVVVLFGHIGLGAFLTLLLLYISGMLNKQSKVEAGENKTPVK